MYKKAWCTYKVVVVVVVVDEPKSHRKQNTATILSIERDKNCTKAL